MLKSILSRIGNYIQTVDPLCLLLMFPVALVLFVALVFVIYDPEHYNTFTRQLSCMFGVGLLWLLGVSKTRDNG